MVVRIDVTVEPATIALDDPQDFKGLAIAVQGSDDGRLAGAVTRLGRADGDDHVFVRPEELKALAGLFSDDPGWRSSFDSMVAYAESKGWIAGDGAIRVHVEHREDADSGA